jgi:hypothetical protein
LKLQKISIFTISIILIFSCFNRHSFDILKKYDKTDKTANDASEDKWEILYRNNLANMKDNYPFYIIRMEAPVLSKRPDNDIPIPGDYFIVKFGDILFPVKEANPVNKFFYIKTADDKYGWICSDFGISLDYDEDPNLYFFNKSYYLTRFIDAKGKIDNSNRIILVKNFVPMLLDNFKTEGFFYPSDYNLALDLSLYAVSISVDQDTYFLAASAYDWSVNEIVVSNNLAADSYHKLKNYDKAIAIHDRLIKSYFWKKSDNALIGGLNSVVKLEKLYLDKIKSEKINSPEYNNIRKKIVDDILITGNTYGIFPVIDLEWHLSAAEWLVVILKNSLSRNEFYDFCDMISSQTTSKGFSDLVLVYKAVEMYKEGKKEDAFKIFSTLKIKNEDNQSLRLEDWLSVNNIIPDSVIYQYNF